MDIGRAEEILNSPDHIKVVYNSSSVWIENIKSNKVEISHLDGSGRETVPVTALVEQP